MQDHPTAIEQRTRVVEMDTIDSALREGHFAKKQMFCNDRLISWSHRRRFQTGLLLAREFAGQKVLDYGCGDGTFLAMLMSSSTAPSDAVGAEVDTSVVEDCRTRFGRQRGLRFLLSDELDTPSHRGAYHAVICMEVLEHVVDIEPVLERFARLLAPSGKLLISVPVETGLPLLVKQAARRVAGWRGIGHYPGTTPYSLNDFRLGLLARGSRQHIVRPVHKNPDGSVFHDHKGFNWMFLRETLTRRFQLELTLGSPLTWLSPHLASQVWFLFRNSNGNR